MKAIAVFVVSVIAVIAVGAATDRIAVGQTESVCVTGGAVPSDSAGLIADCETLLSIKSRLRGSAKLNWWAGRSIEKWDGISVSGGRVTSVLLPNRNLDGVIPAGLGNLANLTSLDFFQNSLSGEIPSELGSLTNLKVLYLSGNQLSGCVPYNLTQVNDNDLASLNLPTCDEEPTATVTPTATPVPTATSPTARIAFASDREGDWEIYVMNADGSGQTRLTDNPGPDLYPNWSPDGRRIAFRSYRDGKVDIYVMNADGSDQTRLTDNEGWYVSNPSWSPDGRLITFTSNRDDPDPNDDNRTLDIYVMNADGSGQTRLTDNEARDTQPSWSPDGRRIAFLSNRDGNWDIYVMNADGSDQTRLTDNDNEAGYVSIPSWSPNGRLITFTSNLDDPDPNDDNRILDIYVMNADGSGQTRLTDNEAGNYSPSWSQDGRLIAFTSNRDGNVEIYVMNADGSNQTRLTDNEARDSFQSWSSGSVPDLPVTPTPQPDNGTAGGRDDSVCVTGGAVPSGSAGLITDCETLLSIKSALRGSVKLNWWAGRSIEEWDGIRVSGRRVTTVWLPDRNLDGVIPAGMGKLSNLRTLSLHGNQLSGEIPVELGNLANLERLHLGANQIGGGIPAELGNLTNLKELWLGDGLDLTGEIPSELSRLARLEVLDLGNSQISGAIPAWLGDLTRLRALYLDGNGFSEELPSELGNLSRLELLTLHGNTGLIGALPQTLTKITGLDWLTFHDTGLCAPVDEIFQTWLRSIPDHEGPNCPSEPTAGTSAQVIVRDVLGRVVNETETVLVD